MGEIAKSSMTSRLTLAVAAMVSGAPTGLLRAEDATGRDDFAREQRMHDHANQPGRQALKRSVSTQREPEPENKPSSLSEGSYAVFEDRKSTRLNSSH